MARGKMEMIGGASGSSHSKKPLPYNPELLKHATC